jgi:hypothetical protein
MRIGIDRGVLRRFLQRDPLDPDSQVISRLFQRVSAVCILPVIVRDLEVNGDEHERKWRDAGIEEIRADEFLTGCATGMSKRYLDYHPDPRDCRLVAEAECAKLDALVTLNQELIRGLARRVENIRIETPSEALKRAGGDAPLE